MDTTRFADLVRGATLDDATYRQDKRRITPAQRCYVVLFSARSGSSWLTSLLSGTELLGRPHEYLNPGFVAGIARSLNADTPRHLLHMLLRHNQTVNGVFGLEARASDIRMLGVEVFRGFMAERAVFFHLWRDNLVAQAVSLYRAVATERYHSDSSAGSDAPPPYDAIAIEAWLRHVAGTENENAAMLRRLRVPARHLQYERIVADRAATLALFAGTLGVALPAAALAAPAATELSKVGDDWNTSVEAQFRAERGELIAAIEAARAVKRGIPGAEPVPPEPEHLLAAWTEGRAAAAANGSRFDPPELPPPELACWRDGWDAGWNDQPLRPPDPGAPVQHARPNLPPEAPDTLLRALRGPLPRPLHDFTALRLIELLAEQARLGVQGGLLEIGLSRGRQTALLLAAPRDPGSRVVGLDLGDGRLAMMLHGYLTTQIGDHGWVANATPLDDVNVDALAQMTGGQARYIGVDAAQAPDRLEEALALADALVGPDGCVAISDFLLPTQLAVTEAVIRFLSAAPRIAPFALLPGRLLLAPIAARGRYQDMMTAFTLRDRVSPLSIRLHQSLARGDAARLEQSLCGFEMIALS